MVHCQVSGFHQSRPHQENRIHFRYLKQRESAAGELTRIVKELMTKYEKV